MNSFTGDMNLNQSDIIIEQKSKYNEISLLKKQVLSLANVYELCKQKVNKILKGQKRLTKKFVQL